MQKGQDDRRRSSGSIAADPARPTTGVVTVHSVTVPFDTRFRTLIDSDLFCPKVLGPGSSALRARLAFPTPSSIVPSTTSPWNNWIAPGNGVTSPGSNADIWYSENPSFSPVWEERQHRYVVEIPRNLQGWLYDPGTNPRHPARSVQELCQQARPMTNQEVGPFHIKDTDKGPRFLEGQSRSILAASAATRFSAPTG